MPPFNQDIQRPVQDNPFFRREVHTGEHSQLVVRRSTRLIRSSCSSPGRARRYPLVIVPAGTTHNFVTTGQPPLKRFTICAPPEEEPGTRHRTRAEAAEGQEE